MDTHYDIVQMQSAQSTQDEASNALATTGVPTLVVADRQTRGRGRQGREWVQPDRALFSSFSFPSQWDPKDLPLVPLCTGVAVRRAIRKTVGTSVDLKWPNDLLVGGRKIGGILVEATGGRVTIGCGLNLWWPDAPPSTAALYVDDPGGSLALDIAQHWVAEISAMVRGDASSWPCVEYSDACVTIGSKVSWSDGSGVALRVSERGHLVVATEHGSVELSSGEVHLGDTPLIS
ncbi:MAG: biotin--[acetyl-CoA-carboxylase] ligase [Acidimicrobiia bacterium]